MHNHKVSDVISDGFDLNQLCPSNDDVIEICNKINKIRAKLSSIPGKRWITEDEVLSECSFITDQHYLSMIFSNSFMSSISASVTGSQRYNSWYLFRKISAWITRNNDIAPIAIFHSSTHETIKNDIIFNYLVDYDSLVKSIKNKKVLNLPATSQESILESCDPEDAKVFIDSGFDKIRLLAYKKIGPISNLDVMIKDPHALIRRYAVRLLSPGDPRLASFINDRSKDVFVQALQKISLSLLPMMIGSNHLKKKHVKEILNQRILAAQG